MKQFLNARRAGVPLLVIETADAAACIRSCVKSMNGKGEETPLLIWDCIQGCRGMNDAGAEALQAADISAEATLNPTEFLAAMHSNAQKPKTPLKRAVIFMLNVGRLIEAERTEGIGFTTGVFLCRDSFKGEGMLLVMLTASVVLPAELKQDVITINEPLPDAEELGDITNSIADDVGKEPTTKQVKENLPAIVDTLRGLSAFASEQAVAMSITKDGIDLQQLRAIKRSYIAQTPGIEVREDKIGFDDIAGYDNIKTVLRRKIEGRRPPRLVIWWDEFDRTIAANSSDTSGVSQDQVAALLTFLQDRLNEDRLSAAILVGVPGGGKSAVTAAVRNEAKCECLRWDMGGMKDSLVGSSEKRIRNALKVVDAMSAGHILVLATANNLTGVPSPVISRFALGCFYFDLPSEDEGLALWKLKRAKYGLVNNEPNPTTARLSGREIQQCCFLADDLKIPLREAIKYITPYYVTNAKELESLRNQAHKRWISASYPGFYVKDGPMSQQGGRAIETD